MRKEISPEMYNYNKFPGPDFVRVADFLKSEDYQFTILEDHKEALDATSFGQRFSEIMLKYDYIVGDWASDQLRLKGFYKEGKKNVRRFEYISHLSEYLREYCSFGCAYFVLENENPVLIKFEEENIPKRKRQKRSKNRKTTTNRDRAADKQRSYSQQEKTQKVNPKQAKRAKTKRNRPEKEGDKGTEQGFKKSRKKRDSRRQSERGQAQVSKTSSASQHFTIRKKGK
ncbi:YutD-like domain-containing protein [Streptococcus dentiloxodontae]